jgi:iron complex transport system substrate-binding protein
VTRRTLLASVLALVAGAAPLLAATALLDPSFAPAGFKAPARTAPRRVASLNLTADEILVDILPPDRLVAVTRFADDPTMSNVAGRVPAGAARFPKADLERLVSLRADLVVVSQFTDGDFLRQLESSGLRAHAMGGLDSLAGIRQAILDLGRVVGEDAAAAAVVARFDDRLAKLTRRLAGAPPPRVLYWSSPYTAGNGTSLGAIIECGGGRNAAAELGIRGLVPLGAERAFVAQPDFILVDPAFESIETLRRHPLLERLRAVREGRIISLPGAQLSTLSHHIAEACWSVAAHLHPDRVGEPAKPAKR